MWDGEDPISRSPAHLRNAGFAKRSGCQNAFHDARTLFRGVHAGYLRPRIPEDAAGRGGKGQRIPATIGHGIKTKGVGYVVYSTPKSTPPRINFRGGYVRKNRKSNILENDPPGMVEGEIR